MPGSENPRDYAPANVVAAAPPQRLPTELARGTTHLMTMGCGERCPFIRGARVWGRRPAP